MVAHPTVMQSRVFESGYSSGHSKICEKIEKTLRILYIWGNSFFGASGQLKATTQSSSINIQNTRPETRNR
jgi:hypothetical protein